MESNDSSSPVVKAVSISVVASGVPEVAALNYVPGYLAISLTFAAGAPLSAEFDGVYGFRVLDEGDLLEFWSPETRVESWLWLVEKDGWFAQERVRSGFLSGVGDRIYSEYLVLGQNDCVSVFSSNVPRIVEDGGKPQTLNSAPDG